MTAHLDTNVVIRHLTGDPPEQARAATALLASGERLLLSDVVTAEAVFVLEGYYERPPAEVAELLRAVLAFDAIEAEGERRLLRALELYGLHGVDFADCYLVAGAELDGTGRVASLDRDIDSLDTVTRVRPHA